MSTFFELFENNEHKIIDSNSVINTIVSRDYSIPTNLKYPSGGDDFVQWVMGLVFDKDYRNSISADFEFYDGYSLSNGDKFNFEGYTLFGAYMSYDEFSKLSHWVGLADNSPIFTRDYTLTYLVNAPHKIITTAMSTKIVSNTPNRYIEARAEDNTIIWGDAYLRQMPVIIDVIKLPIWGATKENVISYTPSSQFPIDRIFILVSNIVGEFDVSDETSATTGRRYMTGLLALRSGNTFKFKFSDGNYTYDQTKLKDINAHIQVFVAYIPVPDNSLKLPNM